MASESDPEKIDVHHAKQQLANTLRKFRDDPTMCAVNKQYILDYLSDSRLGKTILGRQKKTIKEKRLLKTFYTIKRINEWLGNKDFKKITQKEMENFIRRVEENQLVLRKNGTATPVSYKAWTRHDFKVVLRKFYKWLLGDNKSYPDLVSWIDTSMEDRTPPCLSPEEIRRCVDFSPSIRGKALIWTLFETGARAEEFLNIRLNHVTEKASHFVVRIEYPKTFKRSVPVFEAADYLRDWLKLHPQKEEPTAQLFPISYPALRKFLKRLGDRALKKHVHPHLYRHSFATWLASKKVGRYQMCKVMGWAMSSDMPDRYIDRTGVVEEAALQSIRGDELAQVERENTELKVALERLEAQSNTLQERLEKRAEIDDFLTALLKNKEFSQVIMRQIKQKGLGDKLLQL